jgi:hypothetical protein
MIIRLGICIIGSLYGFVKRRLTNHKEEDSFFKSKQKQKTKPFFVFFPVYIKASALPTETFLPWDGANLTKNYMRDRPGHRSVYVCNYTSHTVLNIIMCVCSGYPECYLLQYSQIFCLLFYLCH